MQSLKLFLLFVLLPSTSMNTRGGKKRRNAKTVAVLTNDTTGTIYPLPVIVRTPTIAVHVFAEARDAVGNEKNLTGNKKCT